MGDRMSEPEDRAGREPTAATGLPYRSLVELGVRHLDAVAEIEKAAYPFPWTRGNFIDSLAAGYEARVLLDVHHTLLGYWIAMPGVDEMHLLNITVEPGHQGHGHARFMLDALVQVARERGDRYLWLEVRPSNDRARSLYVRYGFKEVGRRKGYYPAALGRREDALVMSLEVRSST